MTAQIPTGTITAWHSHDGLHHDGHSQSRLDLPLERCSRCGIIPWCSVRISALALLKMAMHAKSGGNIEIMGMLYGKVQGDTFIVIDAFALPVEGTETRVNAQAEAYEYMVDFAETNRVGTAHPLRLDIAAFYIDDPSLCIHLGRL